MALRAHFTTHRRGVARRLAPAGLAGCVALVALGASPAAAHGDHTASAPAAAPASAPAAALPQLPWPADPEGPGAPVPTDPLQEALDRAHLADPGLPGAAGPMALAEPAWPLPGRHPLAGAAQGALSPTGWTSPVPERFPVSAPYRLPGGWAAGYHTGVDFAVPVGTPLSAVGPGTVVSAGWSGDYGNAVMLLMEDGHYVLYAHLDTVAVREGDTVRGGDPVGTSGNTGRSTGPHLHFEVRTDRGYGSDIDPLAYLRGHGVSLD